MPAGRQSGGGVGPGPQEARLGDPDDHAVLEHRHLGVRRRQPGEGRRVAGIVRSIEVEAEDAARREAQAQQVRRRRPTGMSVARSRRRTRRRSTLPAMSLAWAEMP